VQRALFLPAFLLHSTRGLGCCGCRQGGQFKVQQRECWQHSTWEPAAFREYRNGSKLEEGFSKSCEPT